MPSGELFIWAHRGASAQAPENTLAAFGLALELGADGIELDVHLSRDEVPVVIHDETLERTTDGRGKVADRTWADLRALDAGRWFAPSFAGEPVPSLQQALDLVGMRARINVEIKSAAAGQAVLTLLERYPRCQVLVSSFDHRVLARMRRAAPHLPLGFLLDSPGGVALCGGRWRAGRKASTPVRTWSPVLWYRPVSRPASRSFPGPWTRRDGSRSCAASAATACSPTCPGPWRNQVGRCVDRGGAVVD